MGVRVSPNPRNAPVATTCNPSNSWNTAAIASRTTVRCDNRPIPGVEARNRGGKKEKRRRGEDLVDRCDCNRQPTSAPGLGQVPRSNGFAHHNGGRGTDAERDHVGYGCRVQCDCMGGKTHGSKVPAIAVAALNTPTSKPIWRAAGIESVRMARTCGRSGRRFPNAAGSARRIAQNSTTHM